MKKSENQITIEEIEEIRRIWVEEKGEIEDVVPTIYKEVIGQEYPGKELDPMPLDLSDLNLLKNISVEWSNENQSSQDQNIADERAEELYKLNRNLLADSFSGMQNRKRSRRLDEVEKILQTFAFTDAADALFFAQTHDSKEIEKHSDEEYESALEIIYEPTESEPKKIIPIVNSNIIV